MPKLVVSAIALSSLLLLGGAGAAVRPPAPATAPPVRAQKADPSKLKDCEAAWQRQRIKKGSKKAFIRACVRHG